MRVFKRTNILFKLYAVVCLVFVPAWAFWLTFLPHSTGPMEHTFVVIISSLIVGCFVAPLFFLLGCSGMPCVFHLRTGRRVWRLLKTVEVGGQKFVILTDKLGKVDIGDMFLVPVKSFAGPYNNQDDSLCLLLKKTNASDGLVIEVVSVCGGSVVHNSMPISLKLRA